MSAADNVALARRFAERALGAGDMAAFDEIVADDIVVETGLKPDAPIRGKAEYGAVIGERLGAILSNASMDVEEVAALGEDRAMVRFTASADHTGSLWGVPATGRRITMREVHIMRFRDGKLVENLVGGLNPLDWEMIHAAPIRAMLPSTRETA